MGVIINFHGGSAVGLKCGKYGRICNVVVAKNGDLTFGKKWVK